MISTVKPATDPPLHVLILEGHHEINGPPNTHAIDLKRCAI